MAVENTKVVVIGAGVMGHGIAQAFAQGGCQVSLVDVSEDILEKASKLITSSLETMVAERFLDRTVKEVMDSLSFTTSLEEAAPNADFAIEVINENVESKKEIFSQLDALCPPKTILASNTSYLNIFDFEETSRPDKMIITHYYAPPQLIPLVDVVGGPKTSKATLDAMVGLLRQIGKRPLLLKKYIPGYAVNRMQRAMHREVHYLIDNDYLTPEQLDEAVQVGLAFRMMVVGVFGRYDFAGISTRTRHPPGFEEVPVDYHYRKHGELIKKGHLGVKAGRGFYDYAGKTEEEVYRERDVRLIEMARTLKKLQQRGPLGKVYK
ncbi:MAG: 3-hydroxyacyl-CoA dehydrogenase family protein [Deltaproteobacteria bacterium]|nr:3-hydroxyacyl-CoA dehydrogenase family protein [Deltaproteobacteria bacterium]MBW2095868.1 3-hydroxyacyl-CoA dehydrogenase family protein [Deltaproteobacteria bacterium]